MKEERKREREKRKEGGKGDSSGKDDGGPWLDDYADGCVKAVLFLKPTETIFEHLLNKERCIE